jgi:hypothetical protein
MKNINTLSKSITSTFFLREEGYTHLVANWKLAINDQESPTEPSASMLLAYSILRGKDWRKGFTPITRSSKLSSGHYAVHDGALKSLYGLREALRSPLFVGYIRSDTFESIEKLIGIQATIKSLFAEGAKMEDIVAYPGQRVEVAA